MYSEIYAALVALLFFFSLSIFKTLANSKGPTLWPLVGITPTILLHLHDAYHWLTQTLIETGGMFYYRGVWVVGSCGIITARPSHIEYILKTRFQNFPKGGYFRERFQELLGDGIFNADGEAWKRQRGAAMAEMHTTGFQERSLQAAKCMIQDNLMKVLDGYAISGRPLDLQEILLRFTFDSICVLALGVDLGCLSPDLPRVPFARAFEVATELSLLRFIIPSFVWKTMRFLQIGSEVRLKAAVEVVHAFADKTVADRRIESAESENPSTRSDLLSAIMEKYTFSDKELKDLCISLILAGRDTSSVGLAWFFWLVHDRPDVQEKILKEIKGIAGGQKEGIFTVDGLKKMVYLQAALSESLRLYPPVPMDMKEAVEDDVFPDGTRVRKGARVMYSMFSMGRMESVWGRDCGEFRPERWLEEDENGNVVRESQFKYPVFNAGPRLCVGRKFAYMQMKMVAASILMRYTLEVMKGCSVVPKITTTLYMKNGLYITLKPRL